MTRPRYQATMLHQLQTSIEHWEPPPSVGLSARDIIRQLGPRLQLKREQGWRLVDLVAELQNMAIRLSVSTLRSYLSEFRSVQAAGAPSPTPRDPDRTAPAAELPSRLASPQAAHIARLNEEV